MKLCITEKPSVASEIAAIVGATQRCDGYYEGNGYRVTWTIGHLCCLLEPHDYFDQWKMWSLSSLPMLPTKYDVKLIEDAGAKRQFAVIEHLVTQADEIINCGDAGQEGELIQRWVMKKASVSCPVSRLWTSSLTDEALREGFNDLKPQAEYDRLFYAGLSRAIGDWILGMNATRLYTLKYGQRGKVLSIGRVQTPTLALIVRRQQEIDNFTPTDSWELHTQYRDVDFTYTGERYETEDDGNEAVAAIAPLPFVIDDISKKKGREGAPKLFDLTSLQVECNKRWGWSADQTLRLIQSLYEKKLTTYPRVDTTYLSDDIYPTVAPTLRKMTPYERFTAPILARPIVKSKKIFDNAKVTDHHAIIPTGQSPVGIEGDEKKLYHLVAMRFIGVFYPDCVFESTAVTGHAGTYAFKATGRVIIEPGWRVLQSVKGGDSAEPSDNENVLPAFTPGESEPHAPSLVKKTSQAPKPYTEGMLLRAMETAGKTVDSEELREALKANGIGRPSTRAAIIETLLKRGYIKRERKNLVPTQAGIDLIGLIGEELLKSAKLTGLWENKLRRIEAGEFSPTQFIQEISGMVTQIVHNVLSDNSNRRIDMNSEPSATPAKNTAPRKKSVRITRLDQVVCPECGEGHIVKGRTAFGCSRYAQGCPFRLSFDECPPDTKPGQINRLINKKK